MTTHASHSSRPTYIEPCLDESSAREYIPQAVSAGLVPNFPCPNPPSPGLDDHVRVNDYSSGVPRWHSLLQRQGSAVNVVIRIVQHCGKSFLTQITAPRLPSITEERDSRWHVREVACLSVSLFKKAEKRLRQAWYQSVCVHLYCPGTK